MKKIRMIASLFLTLTLIVHFGDAFIEINPSYMPSERQRSVQRDVPWLYGIMLDAGSSGTRVYLYTWQDVQGKVPLVSSVPLNASEFSLQRVRPGIHTFSNNISAISAYLEPLLSYARSKFQVDQISKVPIFLTATGGMRKLNSTNSSAADSVIKETQKILNVSGFYFQNDFSSIINGTAEGWFGWIAVNVILKNFDDPNKVIAGAGDLGGATTQLTFVYNISKANYVDVLGYRIYTYSYINYGNDDSRRSIADLIIADGLAIDNVVYSPCYPTGYNETYIFNSTTYTVFGTSNYTACTIYSQRLLINSTCNLSPCSFNGVYQPPLPTNIPFVFFSAFAFTYESFNLSSNASLNELVSKLPDYCSKNISELKAAYPTDSFVHTNCFSGIYIYTLLNKGYGFPTDYSNWIFSSNVNGTEITYSLGAMTYFASTVLKTNSITSGTSPVITSGVSGVTSGSLSAITSGVVSEDESDSMSIVPTGWIQIIGLFGIGMVFAILS